MAEQVPSAAAPPTVFVCSPIFVHVPVPPVTDVMSLVLPSAVDRLSQATTKTAKWFDAASIAPVVVVSVKLELLVLLTPVPRVPTDDMATA
jgi:hypothetical protein